MFEKLHAFSYVNTPSWKISTPFGTLALQVKTYWHAVWHADMLARKNGKSARFWHVGTQARWHVDHVGTQARMARDLANSFKSHAAGKISKWTKFQKIPDYQDNIPKDFTRNTRRSLKINQA